MVSNEIFILCFVVWLCLIVFMLLYSDYKKWTREGERKSENRQILQKLRSIRLCLMAHPDNEPDSEFADRIEDLNELIENFENTKQFRTLIKQKIKHYDKAKY